MDRDHYQGPEGLEPWKSIKNVISWNLHHHIFFFSIILQLITGMDYWKYSWAKLDTISSSGKSIAPIRMVISFKLSQNITVYLNHIKIHIYRTECTKEAQKKKSWMNNASFFFMDEHLFDRKLLSWTIYLSKKKKQYIL